MPRKNLKASVTEKDVENAYRAGLQKARPQASITSPYNTDGYAQWDKVRLLLEAKFDLDFKARVPVCNTLGQCLLYLKKFEGAGEPLPNVILVGDKNECFVLSTVAVQGFLDLPLDWSAAPSTGNPDLTRALVEGLNILPYVYDVDDKFNFREVLSKCEILAEGEQKAVKATTGNIGAIFVYWVDRVFKDKNLTAVEQVDVFLRCLFQPGEVYPHPTKKGLLVAPGYTDGVVIDPDQYRSFFDHFRQGYKPSEIDRFYGMKDRLVEDDARRRQGAFFTPQLWVDEAHKTLDGVLGVGWREECIVWDPAAGTANLTRDYQDWGDLIVSTAERPDVEVIKEQGWHPGAEVFQYDFLNPGEWSPFFDEADQDKNILPVSVEKRLKAARDAGKRLVFFMNPPYGTAASIETFRSSSKKGVGQTSVNGEMKQIKLGVASGQLYAQFMFQCAHLAQEFGFTEHTVALFSVPTFMSSGSYRKFRAWWYGKHEFKKGWLFQASHFADVSGRWGISFTIWGGLGTTDTRSNQEFTLKDVGGFEVVQAGSKTVYNSNGVEASKWVRELVKGGKAVDAPQMSSGLKIKDTKYGRPKTEALAYQNSLGNNLTESSDSVYVLSCSSSRGQDFSITPANFRRSVALYAARKLVLETWDTQKDEYLVPDTSLPGYEQWVDDAHVYALVHRYNQATAMRNVTYKDKLWTIHNHFFWKTHADALAALDTTETPTLYRDAKNHPSKDVFGNDVGSSPDPYLASLLASGALNLSPEAQAVLDRLDALWSLSLPHRENYAASHPELHLMAWDASIYQLKHIFRDLFPKEWAELQEAFKVLSEKLRPGVYDYGFLRK